VGGEEKGREGVRRAPISCWHSPPHPEGLIQHWADEFINHIFTGRSNVMLVYTQSLRVVFCWWQKAINKEVILSFDKYIYHRMQCQLRASSQQL